MWEHKFTSKKPLNRYDGRAGPKRSYASGAKLTRVCVPRTVNGTGQDYVLTQKFCIGGPDGRLANNVNVESDECRTKYKVKYLSGPAPAPTPSPGGQTCGNVCFKDSDCLTSGGFGCTRCSSYDTGAHGTCY